jgi:hypothetical protein
MFSTRKFDLKNAKASGIEAGGVTIGFVAAYQVAKLVKKDTLLVNVGIAGAGVAVATLSNHVFVQCIGAGIAAFGLTRTANNLAADTLVLHGLGDDAPVTSPIPTAIRAALQHTFPSLQGEADYLQSAIETRLDDAGTEIRAINGFTNLISGAENETITGVPFLMS